METLYGSTLVTSGEAILVEKEMSIPSEYHGLIDLSPMDDGDEFRVSSYIKIKPNGDWRIWASELYKNKQKCPTLRIIRAPTGFAFKIVMQKLKGKDRVFDWMVAIV